MPTNPSSRLGLQAPIGNEDLRQGDDAIRDLVAQLDAVAAVFSIGTGTLPAAGVPGRHRFQGDVGITYFDTGSKWRVMGGHTGQITFTARTTAPFGFLICTGQPITSQYPELRAVLVADGNPYGVDGSGNPRLPNSPGRVLLAAGSGSGLTARTVLGAVLGEEAHLQAHDEVTPHTHSLGFGTSSTIDQGGEFNRHVVKQGASNALDFGDTAENGFTSGSQKKANVMQPSIVLNLLIQT